MKILGAAGYGTFIVEMSGAEIGAAGGLDYSRINNLKAGMSIDLRSNIEHVETVRRDRDRLVLSARNLRALADLLERELVDIGLEDENQEEAAA